ncbi:glycosyl hydrolase family 18 protein [Herbiconiux sp. 11R-BC]|uniref:glycosyl hydrolase family 18 protein n=1 Tax=Herbiconiux sp. 11R-BC TaxID=3111637 RepID=UPI003C006275
MTRPAATALAVALLLPAVVLGASGCVSTFAAGESLRATDGPSGAAPTDGATGTGGSGRPSAAPSIPQPPPSVAPGDSTATDPVVSGLSVEGYLLVEADSARFVAPNRGRVTMIGVDGATIADGGTALLPEPEGSAALVAAAHAAGMSAELLLANFDATTKDFSAGIGAALLRDPVNRTAVIGQLVTAAMRGGYDSVQLDLEDLSAADATGLTAFARELRAALDLVPRVGRARIPISIAIMAKDSPAAYADAGYDFTGLLADIDRVVLMGYDQHGPAWSPPGAVGGLAWAEAALDAMIASGVPPARIDLGVGQYGYSWPGDGTTGIALRVEDARDIAGGRAVFDAEQGEWTATLDDGTVLWWSDERSLALRAQLARERGLHGLAVWQLSSAAF